MSTFTLATTAATRTLLIWFLTNLGGTAWLVFDFCRDSPSDVLVPLIFGLMAALLSLLAVPLAIPLFAIAQHYCMGWRCRLLALAVVLTGFSAGNYLIMQLLPIGTVSSLLNMSQPYLVAAVLAVMWLYRPHRSLQSSQQLVSQRTRIIRRFPIKLSGPTY